MRTGRLLTVAEFAAIFRVDRASVARWARGGRIPYVLTPGGHHRFYESDVEAFLKPHGGVQR